MADIENKEEVAVTEKEIAEEVDTAPKVAAGDEDHGGENGAVEEHGENGTSAATAEKKDDATSAAAAAGGGDAKDGDESKNGNKECTDAPSEAVKRKITGDSSEDASATDAATDETVATPEKKAKLVDTTKESDANGGAVTETAEVAV